MTVTSPLYHWVLMSMQHGMMLAFIIDNELSLGCCHRVLWDAGTITLLHIRVCAFAC